MSGFRASVINASWLVSDRVVRLALSFVVGLAIARHLGPANFGLLSYGQVVLFMLLPLATFGMPEILVREFARAHRSPDTILATAFVLRLGFAVLAFAGTLAFVAFARRGDALALMVVASYGLSFLPQSLEVVESRLQAQNSLGLISTLRMANTVVFSAVRIAALLFDLSVVSFALLYSAEIAVFAGLTVLTARRSGISLRPGLFDRAEARLLVRDSAPLMLRLVAIAIYMRVDQLLIPHLLNDAELGLYSAATRISELWYFVPMAVVMGAAPNLTRRFEEGNEAYLAELGRLLRIIVLLAVAAAGALSLLSPLLLPLLFGPQYAAAAPILAIQAWSGVFVALGVASGPWFINTGHLRYGLYQAVAGAVVSIVLNLALIPVFGLKGAAYSLVISYAVSALLLNACFPATRPLFFLQLKAFVLR